MPKCQVAFQIVTPLCYNIESKNSIQCYACAFGLKSFTMEAER